MSAEEIRSFQNRNFNVPPLRPAASDAPAPRFQFGDAQEHSSRPGFAPPPQFDLRRADVQSLAPQQPLVQFSFYHKRQICCCYVVFQFMFTCSIF